jgi:uncharacterized cupin superfamily protein
VNVFDVEVNWSDDEPEGYRTADRRFSPELGGEQLAFNVFEMAPGQSVCPYHYEDGCEEWIIVLTGRPTLRTPEGERELGPWDCAFCAGDESGAHKVTNRTDEPSRIIIWSNRLSPGTAVYPDSQKLGSWPPGKLFRLADAVDYWDGEPGV